MDVSLLSSLLSSAPTSSHTEAASPDSVPQNTLRFTVALVMPHPDCKWSPNGPRQHMPLENGALPYELAHDLASHLNSKYREIKKNRLAIITRYLNGGAKYGVLTIEAYPEGSGGVPILRKVKFSGLALQDAINEVEKLNTFILEVAKFPKAWAVAIVEGEAVADVA